MQWLCLEPTPFCRSACSPGTLLRFSPCSRHEVKSGLVGECRKNRIRHHPRFLNSRLAVHLVRALLESPPPPAMSLPNVHRRKANRKRTPTCADSTKRKWTPGARRLCTLVTLSQSKHNNLSSLHPMTTTNTSCSGQSPHTCHKFVLPARSSRTKDTSCSGRTPILFPCCSPPGSHSTQRRGCPGRPWAQKKKATCFPRASSCSVRLSGVRHGPVLVAQLPQRASPPPLPCTTCSAVPSAWPGAIDAGDVSAKREASVAAWMGDGRGGQA